MHVARGAPAWCAELPGIRDVDALVALSSLDDGHSLRIVQTQAGLPVEMPPNGKNGQRDLEAIYRAYSQGWTILINGLHNRSAETAKLAKQLGEAVSYDVGVNLYVTPPNAQGFAPHMDGHDVFILQTSGCKEWRVFSPAVDLPLEDQDVKIDPDTLGPCLLQATLEPGHVLYIPRGFVHEGASAGESSLHLTFGIHSLRWVEIVKEPVQVAAERMVQFRRSVPMDSLSPETSSPELINTLGELLGTLASCDLEGDVLKRMGRRHVRSSRPAPDGHFAAIDRAWSLSLHSVVESRPGLTSMVHVENGRARIEFGRNSVHGPAGIAPALRFIAQISRFRVEELADDLSDNSKLVLIRRLVQERLLSFPGGETDD